MRFRVRGSSSFRLIFKKELSLCPWSSSRCAWCFPHRLLKLVFDSFSKHCKRLLSHTKKSDSALFSVKNKLPQPKNVDLNPYKMPAPVPRTHEQQNRTNINSEMALTNVYHYVLTTTSNMEKSKTKEDHDPKRTTENKWVTRSPILEGLAKKKQGDNGGTPQIKCPASPLLLSTPLRLRPTESAPRPRDRRPSGCDVRQRLSPPRTSCSQSPEASQGPRGPIGKASEELVSSIISPRRALFQRLDAGHKQVDAHDCHVTQRSSRTNCPWF